MLIICTNYLGLDKRIVILGLIFKGIIIIISHILMMKDRIVGKYQGNEKGPLVIITSGMHGNEHAGVRALELVFKMLEVEPITNPSFSFKGTVLGLICNVQAYEQRKRYIQKDINRCWSKEHIDDILSTPEEKLENEDLEIRQLLQAIDDEIKSVNANEIFLMDIHTTSANGIFSIASQDPKSISLAKQLPAPVVLGLMDGISGTTLHYFSNHYRNIPCTAIAFEGGFHDDPLSVNRIIAAIISFFRSLGCISAEDVATIHDYILQQYSKGLPHSVYVRYKYHIDDNSLWEMLPGFHHFDQVYQGQKLAFYDGMDVYAPINGVILMPLYQAQGHDGFFICTVEK